MPEKPTYQDLEKRIEIQDKEINFLSKTNERYLHIINSISEGYSEVDLRGNLTFFNDRVPEFQGRTREEMKGMSYREFHTPEQRKRIFEIYNRIYRTGIPEEIKDFGIIKKDGSIGTTEATVSLQRDDSGKPIGFSTFRRDVEEKKIVQDALQEREETYRRILETAPDSIVIMRRSDSKILEVNKAFCQQSGYSPEEVIGRTPLRLNLFATLTDQQQLLEEMEENNGQVDGAQVTYKTKDGSILHNLVSIRIIQFRGEECVLTVATVITPLIEAQKALEESEEKYRKILETMEEGYYEVDLRGNFTFVNQAECRIHQLVPEEMIGLNNQKFTSPEMAKRIYKIYNQVYRTGVPAKIIDYEIIRKDGSVVTLETSASLLRDHEGNAIGFYGISRDLTEKRRAEKVLQESEAKHRKILETMEEGYYETDLKGNFTFFNEALCRIHGYSAEEMMGMNNRQYASPETAKKIYEIYHKVYLTGVTARIVNYEVIRKDGSIIDIESSASLLKDPQGNSIGFYGISRNVTERKKAEKELEAYRMNLEKMVQERTRDLEEAQEELVKKEKLAVLGQLMATVSHELRNPLGVIRSSNFYLQKKINEKNPQIEKYFRRIEEQVGLCDSIVADLLEYTRGRHSETVTMALNPWLEPLLAEIFEGEEITVKKDLTGANAIPHDQEKIRRIIINIADNALLAVKARQESVQKDKEKYYEPQIFIRTREEDGGVIIEISDNGIGMDQETLDRALEPLYTTRARGTGLGLANVDKIVKEHMGKITLKSQPDQGTTVTIFLPNQH